MKEFKIRASAASKIMGKRGLGKTGETYVKEWLTEQLFNRKKSFSNKYTNKGIIMEQDGIDLYAKHNLLPTLLKNDQYFENDFMCGTPDIILEDKIVDIKSSWDCFTFPMFDEYNEDYFFQAQVYMELTGIHKFELAYCLLDTPLHLIEKEAWYKVNDTGADYDEVLEELKDKMTYSDIPDEMRIKTFEIEYSAETIDSIKDRVNECRELIKKLLR